jgi:hypothetical protein
MRTGSLVCVLAAGLSSGCAVAQPAEVRPNSASNVFKDWVSREANDLRGLRQGDPSLQSAIDVLADELRKGERLPRPCPTPTPPSPGQPRKALPVQRDWATLVDAAQASAASQPQSADKLLKLGEAASLLRERTPDPSVLQTIPERPCPKPSPQPVPLEPPRKVEKQQ